MTIAQKHSQVIHSEFFGRFKNDSIDITYQEWCLYWILRMRNSDEEFTNELIQSIFDQIGECDWINEEWNKTPASKYNMKLVSIPWTEVFK